MYSPTRTTTPSRLADRARYDAETMHAILDEALICHVGFVADGRHRCYRCSSSASDRRSSCTRPPAATWRGSLLERAASRSPSRPRSSMHWSSLARLSTTRPITELLWRTAGPLSCGTRACKDEVLDALMEKLAPGRAADVRAPNEAELRQTAVMQLPLVAGVGEGSDRPARRRRRRPVARSLGRHLADPRGPRYAGARAGPDAGHRSPGASARRWPFMILEAAVLNVREARPPTSRPLSSRPRRSSRLRRASAAYGCCDASRRPTATSCWSNGRTSRITSSASASPRRSRSGVDCSITSTSPSLSSSTTSCWSR